MHTMISNGFSSVAWFRNMNDYMTDTQRVASSSLEKSI